MSLARSPAVRAMLDAPVRWHTVRHIPVVGSTNDVAREAVADGEPPGLVVVADRQTAGRGRRGRVWIDEVDARTGPTTLAVTVTCTPTRSAGLTPLVTGLAVADAYAAAGAAPRLKWPNDVLLSGLKAAGILIERSHIAGVDLLLIGCGLDLDWRGVARDTDASAWTSLAEATGSDVDRAVVLASYLASLHRWLDVLDREPTKVLEAYGRRCSTLGVEVRVALPDGDSLVGEAVRIDGEGRLVVRASGGEVTVSAGDVAHLRTS